MKLATLAWILLSALPPAQTPDQIAHKRGHLARVVEELAAGDTLREDWFDEPSYVLRESPSNRGLASANDPGALPGHVLIAFDVTENGRTTDVVVVESVPPGLKDDATARAIGRSRFRPRMVDGEFVRARRLARNFTFHYQPGD